ncbi:autotransporter outer membrane beta-barrel domain-containing protein [Anaerobiospirillum sp. NML120448]|uniref:autotransporter domain-containing protein n=1 Tax=Anaerobiospirillum sp. NML120448 TaxID=2932816 RepID=UPI001FF369C9|nr:autotransporter outer membrane beta-barrel domain-containing protein [Anaerobiospirillum sp. NML120448]MCK0514981.1 autotransporter outer membrane beta-barrel domain-containing protein [Anaerobiospirillum sp. NML120448]
MKQTNNAIKFLMAQYRAIFQNAYFKGLATAAVVTMGLAAGQAQAAKDANAAFTGAEEIPAEQTLIITGKTVSDPDTNLNQYKSFEIAATPTGTFAGNIEIKDGAKANNFIKGAAAIEFTANNLTIATSAAANGLTITGQSGNKSVDATFNEIKITKGDLELVGDAAGKATLNATKISLSGAAANEALLTVGANTITGYALDGQGAAEQAPAAGAAKDLANYTSLELGTNSKLASTASASDATVLNVGSLSINGGDLNVAKGATAATDALTLNLVQGELLNEGKITTVASGTLSVKFADGDFVKDGTAVEKKLTLTKGTLDLTGGMTLSNEGKLVVTDKLDDLTVQGTAGITLTNKAAFAPTDVANAKAVAGKLPLTIGEKGVLDFGATETNLDDLTFAATAATTGNKIGLAATGLIKGDTLSLTKDLGAAGIVSGKTLNVNAAAAVSNATLQATSALNVGTNTQAKKVILTLDNIEAINKKYESITPDTTKNASIKADLLAESGSLGTVANVTDGVLNIHAASDAALDVVAGTWNTNGVDIVLGSGTEAGALNVGAADTALGSNKTAAKLVFGSDSVLTLTKGTVTVGSATNANLLGAELDISALQEGNLSSASGAISVESGGTILANSVLIDTLVDSTKDLKVTISSGGVLDIAEGLEINADTLAVASAAGKGKLAFNGKTGEGLQATLKSDSVTINKATGNSVNIGEFGVIEANTLTLNNDNGGTLENVKLDSGSFIVKQTLTSEGSDLKATLGSANSVLQLGKIVEKGDYSELASASGSSTLDLDLTSGSKVNVVGGQWGLQDVTVTNGKFTVGQDLSSDPARDANGDAITAQVSGGKLTHSAGTVTIKEGSSAKFTELFTTNGATTTVNGVLTVLGQENAKSDTNTQADFGASIDSNIDVTGANAKLVIGTNALGSIKGYKASGAGIEYTTDVDPLFGTNGKVSLDQFGTLELQFAENTKFNLNDLASLRKGVTGETDSLEAGFISIGNASLTDSVVSGGTITAENLDKIKDFKDIVIKDIADATVTGVDSTTVVTGNVGNIQADANVSKVQIGQATLNKANKDGQFAVDANGKQVDLAVSKEGGYLHLVNDGEAKNITLANGVSATQKTNLVVKGKADGQTIINSVKAGTATNTNFEVASGNVKVTQGVQVGTLNTAKDTTLTAESLNITASADGATSEIWGTVNVAKNATFEGDLNVGGQFAVSGDLAAKGETYVAKDGLLTVDGMLTASDTLVVGLDDEKDAQGNVIESGSTGYLFAKTLNLNGQTLFVDPEFGDKTSIAAVKNFGDNKNNKKDAGVIDGDVVVGKNAALMAGQDATIAAMQDYISQYQQNGSLVKGQVENIVYLADKVTLKEGSKIILDSKRSSEEIVDEITKGATGAYAAQFSGAGSNVVADLYLGSNSVLTVSDNILGADQGVAIHFNKTDAAILGEQGSKIVLDGESFLNSREFTLFTDKGTGTGTDTGVKVLGTNNITVESLNGLLVDYLEAGKQDGNISLSLNKKELDSKLLGASAPMRDFLIGFADRKVNWEEVLNAPAGTPVTPEYLVAGKADVLNADGTAIDNAKLPEGTTAKDFVILTEKVDGQDKKVAYRLATNQFLEKVVRNTDGAAADQAARMGDFGGAAETALVATSTTYDAVAGRFGMGQQAGTMTIANNGQGSGLWVTPVYKSHESDGFDADGLGYGSDITLYGVALGGDVTLANGVRVGAMFNVGSGDADGQGAASVVSNDFDYFGGSIYAGYAIDNFSIVGDVSYTTIDSDVEANTAAGKTSTSFDTSALSVGVTGQYALKVAEMDVTPHAGMRFTRIDMDDYTIESADFGNVGQYNASSANVFSIPVGVTISKEYVTDTWTVKPSFDLTLTGNFGDDTVDGTVSWTGVSNWDVSTKAEFVDNFTYGASVGIAAKTGNFGLGLGLNYTGSSNTDEFGVNANARYMF